MTKLSVTQFSGRDDAERYYLAQADSLAEKARSQFLTPGSGQAATYEAKYQEALSGGGPFLEAEAEALGVSVETVAASVIAAREKCRGKEVVIEKARAGAKQRVRRASTAADMHRIVKAFSEELSA
ncbi:hypothetical protein [Halomonas sp. hl-4]|uniref:hypothetical protein n=1 Tax=Halomonas sp. hl-4 TaxID=1761789 RepID=UPI000BB6E360|nr:hypothetical protein [Halomonas sp. hl-4]SNY95580.1 hypothetical protein SAMN04488142_0081 [Halomonas sp. hl-4]